MCPSPLRTPDLATYGPSHNLRQQGHIHVTVARLPPVDRSHGQKALMIKTARQIARTNTGTGA